VFSLPTEGTLLALRRERYELVRLVRRIAGRYGRAIELHVCSTGDPRPVCCGAGGRPRLGRDALLGVCD